MNGPDGAAGKAASGRTEVVLGLAVCSNHLFRAAPTKSWNIPVPALCRSASRCWRLVALLVAGLSLTFTQQIRLVVLIALCRQEAAF
jgi:hypothetical protein